VLPRYPRRDTFRLQMQKKETRQGVTREIIYSESGEPSSECYSLMTNNYAPTGMSHKGSPYTCVSQSLSFCRKKGGEAELMTSEDLSVSAWMIFLPVPAHKACTQRACLGLGLGLVPWRQAFASEFRNVLQIPLGSNPTKPMCSCQ
jgi:hypothetical protein